MKSSLLLTLALSIALPSMAASEKASKDSAKATQKAGHEHGGHEDHGDGEGQKGHAHESKATGAARTDIREISAALHQNLACLEKELGSADHTVFHGCLEAMATLGKDLMALKTPKDPAKKKRVNGYAKNLGLMAHKVDEYKDAKQTDRALDQLKKLKAQVQIIESQFEELAKKEKTQP